MSHVFNDTSSICCDAPLIFGDICSDCREHCGPHHETDDREAEADVVSNVMARAAWAICMFGLASFVAGWVVGTVWYR